MPLRKNHLFIWIPKTAGTSVFTSLNKRLGMKLFLHDFRQFKNQGSASFGHLDVKELVRMGVITKEYWDKVKPFTIVRNPYDRFRSLWADFKKSKRIAPTTTLREFAWAMHQFTRKPGLFNVLDYSQCASQVEWIVPGTKVLRFETLADDLKENFGIEDLPHLNKGNKDNWRTDYTPETMRLVKNLYQDDFVLLRYDME